MTQEEMNREMTAKESAGMRFKDVVLPGASKVSVRVFADGFAYALNGFGGRYVKFMGTQVWDYDAPGAALQQSHADKKWEELNQALTAAWAVVQS